jgi:hypothetical protein
MAAHNSTGAKRAAASASTKAGHREPEGTTRNVPEPQAAPVDDVVTLPRDAIAFIRRGLTIGLASYGEIERLADAQELMKLCNKPVPKALRLKHPTGRSDTVCELAEAFAFLDLAESPWEDNEDDDEEEAEAANG